MKLNELFPHPEDVFDTEKLRQDVEARSSNTDTRYTEKTPALTPPRKDSNVAKAKRIRNLVRMKVRDVVKGQENDDTHHTYNLGGHVSTFLNR